jgi:hypothetical protein
MASHAINLTLLQPGQRVAVFPTDAASGATLGYYGTVVKVFFQTVRAHPSDPSRWMYGVYVPAIRDEVELKGGDVVALGPAAEEGVEDGLAVRFETLPGVDNDELQGVFRPLRGDWGYFQFRKRRQPQASYQLRAPVIGPCSIGEGVLVYNVPCEQRLDRCFVLQALAQVMGTTSETAPGG